MLGPLQFVINMNHFDVNVSLISKFVFAKAGGVMWTVKRLFKAAVEYRSGGKAGGLMASMR